MSEQERQIPDRQQDSQRAQAELSSPSGQSELQQLSPPPFLIRAQAVPFDSKPTAQTATSFPIQRFVQRENGRPIRKEDPFTVPTDYAAFEAQLVRWIHPVVDSEREETLVQAANPAGLWSALRNQSGASVNLQAQFHWGTDRIERIEFVLPLEGMTVNPPEAEETEAPAVPVRPAREIPLPDSPEVAGEIEAAGAERSRNPVDRLIASGASAVTGGTLAAGRIGALLTGAQVLESSLAVASAVVSSFNMLWAVFNIYREIEGDKASGLGIVDYTGMVAAWMLNDQAGSPHSQALQYARAMEDFNGEEEIYFDALRSARQQAHNAWSRIQASPTELEQIRQAFRGNTIGLQEGLIDRLKPHIDDYTIRDAYMPMFLERWKSRRSFFRG